MSDFIYDVIKYVLKNIQAHGLKGNPPRKVVYKDDVDEHVYHALFREYDGLDPFSDLLVLVDYSIFGISKQPIVFSRHKVTCKEGSLQYNQIRSVEATGKYVLSFKLKDETEVEWHLKNSEWLASLFNCILDTRKEYVEVLYSRAEEIRSRYRWGNWEHEELGAMINYYYDLYEYYGKKEVCLHLARLLKNHTYYATNLSHDGSYYYEKLLETGNLREKNEAYKVLLNHYEYRDEYKEKATQLAIKGLQITNRESLIYLCKQDPMTLEECLDDQMMEAYLNLEDIGLHLKLAKYLAFRNKDKCLEILKRYEYILKDEEADEEIKKDIYRIQNTLLYNAKYNGDAKEVLECFQYAIKFKNRYLSFHYLLIVKDFCEAEGIVAFEDFDAAIEEVSKVNVENIYFIGKYYEDNGNYETALKWYEKGAKIENFYQENCIKKCEELAKYKEDASDIKEETFYEEDLELEMNFEESTTDEMTIDLEAEEEVLDDHPEMTLESIIERVDHETLSMDEYREYGVILFEYEDYTRARKCLEKVKDDNQSEYMLGYIYEHDPYTMGIFAQMKYHDAYKHGLEKAKDAYINVSLNGHDVFPDYKEMIEIIKSGNTSYEDRLEEFEDKLKPKKVVKPEIDKDYEISKEISEAKQWIATGRHKFAIDNLKKAINFGSAEAMCMLGDIHLRYEKGLQNFDRAKKLFTEAKEKGYRKADEYLVKHEEVAEVVEQAYAGNIKHFGELEDVDETMFKQYATLVHYGYGYYSEYVYCCYRGLGTKVNLDEVVKYIKNALNEKTAIAYFIQGLLHARGKGYTRSYELASKYMNQALNSNEMKLYTGYSYDFIRLFSAYVESNKDYILNCEKNPFYPEELKEKAENDDLESILILSKAIMATIESGDEWYYIKKAADLGDSFSVKLYEVHQSLEK